MKDRTILVTGGGSGIGRGLAEAFHERGAKVIISGRRQELLDAVCSDNPGIEAVSVDIADAEGIRRFAGEIVQRFPALNMLVNNAGIMVLEDLTSDPVDLDVAERTIVTNLLGPIRLTAALLPHLRRQARASIVNLTSGLAYVPMAAAPTYSATKAAMHSWSMSLRQQLRETNVSVTELAPPYVQTRLLGDHQAVDPNAMPLDAFIKETMANFDQQSDAPENLVEGAKFLRNAEREGRFDQVFGAVNSMHM